MRNNFKAGYKKRLTLDTSKTSVIAIGVSNLEQILAESIDREFLKKRLQEFFKVPHHNTPLFTISELIFQISTYKTAPEISSLQCVFHI